MTRTDRIKISINGVSKSYPDGKGQETTVLDNVSLDIYDGEFVSIVGPSGCGKTTLINIMAGFEKYGHGSIKIDGETINEPNPDRIMIFQDYGLFPWKTALGNILFALAAKGLSGREAKEKAFQYLELVGLSDIANKYPHQLSGGMKQRVSIARALAVEPSVLFMDEPFAALDAFTRLRLQDELLRLRRDNGQTIIFVTHDLDEAVYLSERIIMMSPNPGRIQHELTVTLPRPADRNSDKFIEYRKQLFREFRLIHEQAEYCI